MELSETRKKIAARVSAVEAERDAQAAKLASKIRAAEEAWDRFDVVVADVHALIADRASPALDIWERHGALPQIFKKTAHSGWVLNWDRDFAVILRTDGSYAVGDFGPFPALDKRVAIVDNWRETETWSPRTSDLRLINEGQGAHDLAFDISGEIHFKFTDMKDRAASKPAADHVIDAVAHAIANGAL